ARVSPRTCEIVGVTAVDAIEITAFEALVHPDDRLRVHDALRATLDPNAPLSFRMIFRAVRGDGDIAWVGLRGATLCSGAGRDRRPDRCLAAVVDLTTEFRELEERARLAAIVTSSDDAITAERLDGTVTHWNPAAERMFGFTAREMLGQSVIPLLPPELAEEEQALFASVRTGHAVSGHPTERLTRAGRRIAVSVTMSPIRNDAGEIVGVSSITRDETAHRALEQQYRQAQKLEAIGQLAGGVAHDLNNILTVVSGGVEFALESPSIDDVSRGDLIAVRTECFRAAGIIRQLLTFGRQQPMAPRTLALNEIIQDLRPMLARLLNEDVTLETELHATGGVLADREQVVQVLLNLAVNARDAMSRGGTLTMGTIDADGTADRGDSVVLRVSDTGCGMSDEVKAHVFEPFFTTKPVGCGTGLGLATVYGIVAQCHGTVSVESTVGQGTTFTIVFPRASVPPTVTPTPDDQVPADVRGNETILVVEDETVLRNQIARALRGAGYRVLEGRNGNDALIALEHHGAPVHLVVSDVVMPEMSGGELVAQLREWYPRLKVLFISGYSQEAVRRYGVGVAESAVLPKPFELRQLCRRIRAVLDGP
ncbi:MAG TPA: PAS domain S-box protein, partial [Gemmatimonadaceae bacterium]|nr:PAS domain S-box protein [Gemmatimonadaceae bacterium]